MEQYSIPENPEIIPGVDQEEDVKTEHNGDSVIARLPLNSSAPDIELGPEEVQERKRATLTSGGPSGGVEKKQKSKKKRERSSTAVVYVSRIPPGMDVGALRSLLSKTGKIGRIYLRPETAEQRKERRALGGRRRSGFIDGWVEFQRKADAKTAVTLLNGRPMHAGKRRGRWADDLWCLRLLKGYTWADFVEETMGTKRERTLRVKAEVDAARRERLFVEERAALAKKIGIEPDDNRPVIRRFKQKAARKDEAFEEDVDEKRAREAQERIDSGNAPAQVDTELVGLLFGKHK